MITNIKQLLKIYNVNTEDKLNWLHISSHQKLSESFIEKHSDKVELCFNTTLID